jgi:hypothetical protein
MQGRLMDHANEKLAAINPAAEADRLIGSSGSSPGSAE